MEKHTGIQNKSKWVEQTRMFVQQHLAGAEGGHDYWHAYRVWKMVQRLAREETVNELVVELAALLHDVADAKFNGGDEAAGPQLAARFMQSINVDAACIESVIQIIRQVSYKGGHGQTNCPSAELALVQDADRLDAIGAIGIARTFNYGGYKNRPLYDPQIAPQQYANAQAYRNSQAPTLNHFYEKLLLLKAGMHTRAAQRIAAERHRVMEDFISRFLAEWEGEE